MKKACICILILILFSIFSQAYVNSKNVSYGSYPEIEIMKPKEGYLYIFDNEIMPTGGSTIIIGGITVKVRADEKDVLICFYVDDFFKHSDSSPPYTWKWDEASLSSHDMEVMGYKDNACFYQKREVNYINTPSQVFNIPPQPLLVSPSNTNVLYNKDCTLVSEEFTVVRAIDLRNSDDIVSAEFEYSRDGENWIPITAFLPKNPEIVLNDGNNIKVDDDAWSAGWSLADLSEGEYYIKVIMEDKWGRIGTDTKKIYYDPTPPSPRILSPREENVDGKINITVTTKDRDVVMMKVLCSPLLPDYYKQSGLGREKDDHIGPAGNDGVNRYCTPTAAKNALHRLASNYDALLFPPDESEEAKNIAMAKELAVWMKTTPNEGTATIGASPVNFYESDDVSPGIHAYLYARGFRGAEKYFVTSYKTGYTAEGNELKPLTTSINWNIFEREIQKGSAVIVDIHKWDRKENTVGGGHTLTGEGIKHTSSNGKHTCSFIDPENGKEITTSWKTIDGFPSLEYPPHSGEWWIINGIWSIFPQYLANEEIGRDSNPSDGWKVTLNTSSLENGLYLVDVLLEDSQGNISITSFHLLINNP